jgi:hypothetical protein
MPRYIDADEAIRISKEDKFMWVYDLTDLDEFLVGVPTAEVVPTTEVDKARLQAYENGKREVVRELYTALYNEIIDARNSNFEAIKERETKHNANRYEDGFCQYCDGKIHALDGIFYFITELTKKYMEGQNNQ